MTDGSKRLHEMSFQEIEKDLAAVRPADVLAETAPTGEAEAPFEGEEEDEEEGGGGLYEHFRVVADKGQQLLRVDKFLQDHLPDTSRNRI